MEMCIKVVNIAAVAGAEKHNMEENGEDLVKDVLEKKAVNRAEKAVNRVDVDEDVK